MTEISPDSIMEKINQRPPVPLTKDEVFWAIDKCLEILCNEPNVLHLSAPIQVVGDLHGQLYDFLEIFRITPPPPHRKFLFLGDYVDRGHYSVEVMTYLICLKIKYPNDVFLLRGNHESMHVTFTYGFYQECNTKFGSNIVSKRYYDLFNALPLSAKIDDAFLCMHGGISPSIHKIEQIDAIDRFHEPDDSGPMTDLLWADPVTHVSGFIASARGCSFGFGEEAAKKFNHLNGLNAIIRAHQITPQGYQFWFDNNVITVWSAPNYCYSQGNFASVLRVSANEDSYDLSFNVYSAVPSAERSVPPNKDIISPYFL